MVSNLVTIQIKELLENAEGSLIFRKPKASEMILIADEQTKLQDENHFREKDGLDKKDLSPGLITVIQDLVLNCYIKGIDETGNEISKEDFEMNFVDLQSVLVAFSKLSETKDLIKKNQK